MGMHPDTVRLQKADLRIRQLEARVRELENRLAVLGPYEVAK
jgi:hypothetical protein